MVLKSFSLKPMTASPLKMINRESKLPFALTYKS
ncbi:hypothetical protein SAMN05216593_113159 [Pseudomonas asturiensis]|uniref:Uncharacterized protein n=1 Tax=Pseudomonas asturiensis TaxID=1190415 RepID=A0A1M7PUN9_9PSED|nr:hypothetical protein SAMN05216593_113159 [Pseudomonas asturiensis]